ncbi:MAG TPA: DUF1616 domain-containing protein [Candidatus Saccharimonadales bacterium]|nr:DUF1616 domain-containing protein [Candidatus Saccharimonadales bacterium]
MAKEQRPTTTQQSRYRQYGVYFFVGIMLVLAVGAYAGRHAIYDQLYDWKLIPRPERLTELYFTEHTKLPRTYQSGQQQAVRFIVRNLEYRTTTYTYVVTQEAEAGKASQELARGIFTLGQDKSKRLDVPVQLTNQGAKSRIVVTVIYDGIAFGQDAPSKQQQAIYYWVAKEGQP